MRGWKQTFVSSCGVSHADQRPTSVEPQFASIGYACLVHERRARKAAARDSWNRDTARLAHQTLPVQASNALQGDACPASDRDDPAGSAAFLFVRIFQTCRSVSRCSKASTRVDLMP